MQRLDAPGFRGNLDVYCKHCTDEEGNLNVTREKMQTFDANLENLQPSQLYVCSDKLAAIERQAFLDGWSALEPLPVRRLSSRTVLTDGHTRALAAFRRGRTSVHAYWDTDDLDWAAYEICVQWCLQEGVRSVADLDSRVVTAVDYEELWLERCRAMHARLSVETHGTQSTISCRRRSKGRA